jgi:hypothetical protein
MNQDDPPNPTWDWKPGPFDPPVQYAFIPDGLDCHEPNTGPAEEDSKPPLVSCTEWRLRVHYKSGEGNQDIGLAYGASCDGDPDDNGNDECTSDIQLHDAASQVELAHGRRRGVALRITPDGHRLAYFSKKHLRFMSWDLPTARRKAISPRLDTQMFQDVHSLAISPDGEYFALSFGGNRRHLLLTEFTTGRTTTIPGYCGILDMSEGASRIAAQRVCDYTEEKSPVTILRRDGSVLTEWEDAGTSAALSPDGRSMVEIHATISEDGDEYLVTRDTTTGEVTRKLKLRLLSEPSDATGHAWLNDTEYIVEAEPPESGGSFGYYRVNITTGASSRIRDLGLDLGETVSIGNALIRR